MTQHVRAAYSRHHRRTATVAAALAVAVILAVVAVPAGAANAPSGLGVTPTIVALGGQYHDCTAVGSPAPHEFRIENPKSNTTYTDASTGATFTLKLSAYQLLLDFTISGGAASDVVIKGGTKSTRYDYVGAGKGYVTADTKLHAPPKGSTYYGISHVTFCYGDVAEISGTVFHDSNGDGDQDGFESGQSGWTLRLYGPSSLLATTSSDGSGAYSFGSRPLGVEYTICETAPTGTWTQSTPTTAVCSGAGEEPNGHQFTPTAAASKSFGNLETVVVGCGDTATGDGYAVQLGGADDANCEKTGDTEYVFETWAEGGQQYAKFVPAATSSGTDKVLIVEKLTWTFTGTSQNASTLRYDDDASDGLNYVPMPFCDYDPRDLGAGELVLQPNVDPAAVSSASSCLISSTESLPTTEGDPSTRVDIVFSSVDGYRTTP